MNHTYNFMDNTNNMSLELSSRYKLTWNTDRYVKEGCNLFLVCTECGQGMHTTSQIRSCKKQNPLLRFTPKHNKYYFSTFKRFCMWLTS